MILLEVALERRVALAGLVAERGARASHEIGVVLGDALLLAPHAPAHDGDAAQQDGTADATDDAADDGLLLAAEAARRA